MDSKEIEELREKLNDTIKSVRAVKGEQFAEFLQWLTAATHLQGMVANICMALDDEDMTKAVGEQLNGVLAHATSLLANAYDMEEKEVRELLKWTSTMQNHIMALYTGDES